MTTATNRMVASHELAMAGGAFLNWTRVSVLVFVCCHVIDVCFLSPQQQQQQQERDTNALAWLVFTTLQSWLGRAVYVALATLVCVVCKILAVTVLAVSIYFSEILFRILYRRYKDVERNFLM